MAPRTPVRTQDGQDHPLNCVKLGKTRGQWPFRLPSSRAALLINHACIDCIEGKYGDVKLFAPYGPWYMWEMTISWSFLYNRKEMASEVAQWPRRSHMTSESNFLTLITYAPMSLWSLTVTSHKSSLPFTPSSSPSNLARRVHWLPELRSEVKTWERHPRLISTI